MRLSLPLTNTESFSPQSKRHKHRRTASQSAKTSDYYNNFITRTPSVNEYYRPSSAISSPHSSKQNPLKFKDAYRINYINLSEAENDQLHVQRLTQIVSSASLARKINQTQKKQSTSPYIDLKRKRIARYDEFRKIGEFIDVIKSGTSPMEVQIVRNMSKEKKSIKPTLAKIDIFQKDLKWLQSLDSDLLHKNMIKTQLNLLKRSTAAFENAKRVTESLIKRPNMDGIAGHQPFFDINRKSLSRFRRSQGMTASSFYSKKQREYLNDLEKRGDILEISPVDLASPIFSPKEEHLFGLRGRISTPKF